MTPNQPSDKTASRGKASEPGAPPKGPFTREKADKLIRGEITLGQYAGLPMQTQYKIASLGHQMLTMGRNDTALQIFQGLVAASPFDSVFHTHLACAMVRNGQHDEAMKHYSLALNYNRANVDALCSRGELYLRKQDVVPAIRDLEAAAAADPDSKHPAGQRARALLVWLASLHKKVEAAEGGAAKEGAAPSASASTPEPAGAAKAAAGKTGAEKAATATAGTNQQKK